MKVTFDPDKIAHVFSELSEGKISKMEFKQALHTHDEQDQPQQLCQLLLRAGIPPMVGKMVREHFKTVQKSHDLDTMNVGPVNYRGQCSPLPN